MTTALVAKNDPLEQLLQRVDGKYHYPALRFVEFLRESKLPPGEAATWDAYLAGLSKVGAGGRRYSASTYNVRMAAMKSVVREAIKLAPQMSAGQARDFEDHLKGLKSKRKPKPSSYIPDKLMTQAEVQMLIKRVQLPNWGLPTRHLNSKGKKVLNKGEERKPHLWLALMIEFLWETACRVSEMTGVLLTDLKRTNGHYRIRIVGKGDRERFLSVDAILIDKIRKCFGSKTYLFESRNAGQSKVADHRYSRTYVSQQVHTVGMALLGREISAHAFRHSALTHYYKVTKDVLKTQQFAGHADPQVTLAYYVHVANDPVETLGIMQLPQEATA
jgi:integrase